MDPSTSRSVKEITECYHTLLCKNLILTDDFYKTLASYGVFSDHLIKDIRSEPVESRKEKLVQLLQTRTPTAFKKFIDVLEVMGHHFLSDCLREAEHYSDQYSSVDIRDMERKLPFLQKSIKSDGQRKELEQYFIELIQREVVKQTWKGDIRTKEKLIFSRQRQIEQMWQFEEKSKIRDKSMQELQESYYDLQLHSDDLRRECKSLHKHIDDLNRKHMDEIKSQIDFNMANDKQLTKLNAKAGDADSVLNDMHTQIKEVMGLEYYSKQAVHEYRNLMSNFQKLCVKHKELIRLVDHFQQERRYLSNQVSGFTVADADDLKPLFQQYLVRNEEELSQCKARIDALQRQSQQKSLKLQELEWLKKKLEQGEIHGERYSTKLALLQKESEENRLKIIDKDDHILRLQKQVKALTDRLSALEGAIATSKSDEQQIREAVEAATAEAAAAASKVPADEETPQEQTNGSHTTADSPEEVKQPGPPPPTQHQGKIRGRPTVPVETRHSYLLKKQGGAGPIYVMDKEATSPSEEDPAPTSSFIKAPDAGISDPVNFSQAPNMHRKSITSTTATNYSKRLAASKAVRKSKSLGNTAAPTVGGGVSSLIRGK